MRINGTDVSAYMAKQMNVVVSHADMQNNSKWIPGAALPLLFGSQIGFKQAQVTLSVHGANGRDDIIQNCSKIIGLCSGVVNLTLDGFSHKFKGYLSATDRKERTLHKWHLLTLTFMVYEYGSEVSAGSSQDAANAQSVLTINNPGTAVSPLLLTLKSKTDKTYLNIKGACHSQSGKVVPDIRLNGIYNGEVIKLDGITGKFTTSNGNPSTEAIKDVNIWLMPSVGPGTTTITCDSVFVSMDARVIPIYW